MIYFTAHTFKCVCHCRRAMFIVLGMYNFEVTVNNKKVLVLLFKNYSEISNFQKWHKLVILSIQIECITYNLNSKLCLKAYLILFNFRPKLLGYLILENPKMLLTILEFTAKLLNIYPALCSQIWLAKKVPTIFEYNSFMTLIIQSTLEKYIVAWNLS